MATATGFQDNALAARMRDAIRRLAIQTIDEERPPYRYGTVTAIYPDLRQVDVQFPGDTTSVPVKLLDTQPVSTGQVVQVSGKSGDRFVSGVVGAARATDVTEADLGTPSGRLLSPAVERVTYSWNEVTNAYKYEVQFAEDSGFTTNVRTFYTTATTITLDNLNPGTAIYGRVRAMNNAGGAGPYGTDGPVLVEDFPASGSDGSPPPSSPDPVITEGLGYLLAEWLPVTNTDPVTYEVHLSTASGFTPSSATKVGETGSTFFFAKRDADGFELAFDTTYFIRIVAKDADGAASPSAQGSGQIERVETGDVGVIDLGAITDGAAPSSSPAADVTSGIGYLYTSWAHISNADPVTYEVHVSASSGFVPDSNSLVGETPSNWFFIRNKGPGAGGGPLDYGVTYYVKLVAKDADGAAGAGVQDSAVVLRTQNTDIEANAITETEILDGSIKTPKLDSEAITADKMKVGTITAATAVIAEGAITSAKIADASIGSAKISDATITNVIIGEASVQRALINWLAVDTAHIADAAINRLKVQDGEITNAKILSLDAAKITTGFLDAARIAAGSISAKHIVVGEIYKGEVLDDPEFETSRWTSGRPHGWNAWNTGPTKETNVTRLGGAAARWNVAGGVSAGMTRTLSFPYADVDGVEVEIDWQLVSGSHTAAGLIVDWVRTDGTSVRTTVNLSVEVPSPVLGKWYTTRVTIPRPTALADTDLNQFRFYVMGSWNGFGAQNAVDIVFDRVRVRPRAKTPGELLDSGSILPGTVIQSANYNGSGPAAADGTIGFAIDGDGNAEFNNIAVRGTLKSAIASDGRYITVGIQSVVADLGIATVNFYTGLPDETAPATIGALHYSASGIHALQINGPRNSNSTFPATITLYGPVSDGTVQISYEVPSGGRHSFTGFVGMGTLETNYAQVRYGFRGYGGAGIPIERTSGQPSIKATTDAAGWLIMESSGSPAALNYYTADEVWLARGGGTVRIKGRGLATNVLEPDGSAYIQLFPGETSGGFHMSAWSGMRLIAVSPGGLQVMTNTFGSWRPVHASAFNVNSAEANKRNITVVADDYLSQAKVARDRGVVARFVRIDPERDEAGIPSEEELGLIADRLPSECQTTMIEEMDVDGKPTKSSTGYSLSAVCAWQQRIIEQLIERVETLEQRTPVTPPS